VPIILLIVALLLPTFAEAEPYRLGVIVPLSGDAHIWGQRIRQGVELAVEAHPGKFEVFFEDEGFCDAQRALSAAQFLLHQKKVDALIMGCLAGFKTVMPVAERSNVLVLSAGLLTGNPEDARPLAISLAGQIASEAHALMSAMRARGVKSVSVFRMEDEFTQALASHFQTGEPRSLSDFPVKNTETDFRTGLAQAAQRKPDALFTCLGEQQLLAFMRQRDALGMKLPVYGPYMVEGNNLTEADRKQLEGIIYTYPSLKEESDPEYRAFLEKFRSRFGGTDAAAQSVYVYDGVMILAEALSACSDRSPICIKKFFVRNGNSWDGMAGRFRFLPTGYVERDFLVKQVSAGKFLRIP
jgi:branched-chain amino acid transport system substrate-binding protein